MTPTTTPIKIDSVCHIKILKSCYRSMTDEPYRDECKDIPPVHDDQCYEME